MKNYLICLIFIFIILLIIWHYNSYLTKLKLKLKLNPNDNQIEYFNVPNTTENEIPSRPIILKLKSLSENSIEIIWKRSETPPYAPITKHVIMIKNEDNYVSDLFLNFIEKTDCIECQYIIENLHPKTNYTISIIASNKYGDSEPAIPQSIRTLDKEELPVPTPTQQISKQYEPSLPPNNVQPKFWEDEAKELEKIKSDINKDQYDQLIETAQGVLEHKSGYPDFYPKEYLNGLENEPNKLSELIKQSLYHGEVVVKLNTSS